MMTEAALTSFIAALFSIMNPIGNIGVFAGLTANRGPAEALRTAWTCALASAVTLLVVAWAGQDILAFFGIKVNSMRIAGGVIVFLIGLGMLNNKDDHRSSEQEKEDAKQRNAIAVVPLAIPLVAGPGTMTTVLVAAQHQETVLSRVEISVVAIIMSVLVGVLFSFAAPLSKWLGVTTMSMVTRLMGLVLMTIAIVMLVDGLKVAFPVLAG